MDRKERALEDLVQKTLKNVRMETPSLDFTTNIMSGIKASSQSEITKYKSPISKTSWVIIFVCVGLLCTYLLMNSSGEEPSWLLNLDYSFLSENKLVSGLHNLTMPSSVLYGIVALAVMTIIQVPIYKNYYDKRLGV